MRHIGELMKELGFNTNAPLTTQKAFVEHLIRASGIQLQAPQVKPEFQNKQTVDDKLEAVRTEPEQLSFNLDEAS